MPFLKQSVTIGRSHENDCVVNDPYVGRLHCRIDRMGDDRFFLTDLNSKNGTYVNGSRVSGGMEIGPYDTVRVGNTQVPWRPYFEREEVPEPEGGDNGGAVDVPPERSTVVPPIKKTVLPPKKRNAALPWILLGILLLTAGLVCFLIVKPHQEETKQPDPITKVDRNIEEARAAYEEAYKEYAKAKEQVESCEKRIATYEAKIKEIDRNAKMISKGTTPKEIALKQSELRHAIMISQDGIKKEKERLECLKAKLQQLESIMLQKKQEFEAIRSSDPLPLPNFPEKNDTF